MAYWHMQLHPDDKDWEREKELLEKINVIGVKGNSINDIEKFKNKVKVRDIVLIRRYNEPIALVEIIGEFEDSFNSKIIDDRIINDDYSRLDWFRYRRKIKILDFAKDNYKYDFFESKDFLVKILKGGQPYKYIQNWYKKISPSFFKNQKGLKLKIIYIQDYKLFEEFNLNLLDSNDEPLSIVVIAGINGSGKTTLLKYINDFSDYIYDKDIDKSFINFDMNDKSTKQHKTETINYNNSFEIDKVIGQNNRKESFIKKYFRENIEYFPTDKGIKDIKKLMLEYLEDMVWKKNVSAFDAFEKLRTYINEIFANLNIMIEFDSRDGKGNLFFRNKKGDKFSIDAISTGEKTLISKVLYLYLNEIKDKVILIDEPELSLHPKWQNRILELYKNFAEKNNCQIIIATHSPHIIGSAKNEYIRVLRVNEDNNKVEVINNVLAYGRDIEWVLEEVMGAEYTRAKKISDKFDDIQQLINNEKFDEAQNELDKLEGLIGENDNDILRLRNDLAFERMELEEGS